jgi:hypothetical protein
VVSAVKLGASSPSRIAIYSLQWSQRIGSRC